MVINPALMGNHNHDTHSRHTPQRHPALTMNPIGILTFYLLRLVGLGDVGRYWFVGRRLRYCQFYGPGIVAIGNNVTLTNNRFNNCDFIRVPMHSRWLSAHLLDGCTIDRCVFHNVAVIGDEDAIGIIMRDLADQEIEAVDAMPERV